MARDGSVVPADPQAMAVVKKKTQSSRSWILFDASGKGSLMDVDKYAIMHRVQIHARDLRILDPLLSYPSTILGREKAIVLNLEHIKAIITAEEVLLRDPTDDNVVPVVEELQRRLPQVGSGQQQEGDGKEYNVGQHDMEGNEEDESPFEFRALEVALEAICSFLAARTTELEMAAYPALDELTSKISSRNLDRVRKLKSAMTRLTARVQKVRDELEQLLDDDDDMADLYLSRKLASASPVSGSRGGGGGGSWFAASPTIGSKISRASRASLATVHLDENDVEELEMLLEAYFMQIDGTLNKLTTLREYIDDTEDYINIQNYLFFGQLDNHRNQLIQLELFLSSGTVCLAFFSLVTGIFGMNIPYTWNQNHGYMFKWVVIITGTIAAVTFLLIIAYARKKGLVGS
ncbi:Magnesium transporter MRS2-2 [Stylosanthes scabra]|uniref:Magnesium transporter n=1 Tax=Stylosanthes scabra TaxID=79078 RepID=A0ABU6T4U8_9FABA|nr:Magnesium transporter MRS2-2 [Stylosanthes scabra]